MKYSKNEIRDIIKEEISKSLYKRGDIILATDRKKYIVKDISEDGLFVQEKWTNKKIGYGGVKLVRWKDIIKKLKFSLPD